MMIANKLFNYLTNWNKKCAFHNLELDRKTIWRPPITTEFRGCATGVTGKMVAASATVALNAIYLAFKIFQSYIICNVINLFIQKENG
jgi:hypothetical protein